MFGASGFEDGGRAVCVVAMGLGLALGAAGASRAADSEWTVTDQVRLDSQRDGFAVIRAVEGALHRLGNAHCQAVLSDFKDLTGRNLQEVLDAREETAQDRLRQLLFYDYEKGRYTPCREGSPLAFTMPGSRVIFICGREFRRAAEENRARAEALIIHEFLHSLGLGENPPTSREITNAVLTQCMR